MQKVIFIHGLFNTNLVWKEWEQYFTDKGFSCESLSYPYHVGEPADLRAQPNPKLANLTLGNIMETFTAQLAKLPTKPIVIGHSMGGLIAQLLNAKGLVSKAICISSAPPKGIISFSWDFISCNLPIINPFKGNSLFMPNLKWFHNGFCHTLSIAEAEAVFNKYVIAESRNIPRSSQLANGYINFKQEHAPMLFISGELDKIVPAVVNKKNFKAYKSNSMRELKVFEGRTHYILGQNGWQQVAQHAIDFINR
jgi:pimeloyl-ACP methyl ester carboxylesterase